MKRASDGWLALVLVAALGCRSRAGGAPAPTASGGAPALPSAAVASVEPAPLVSGAAPASAPSPAAPAKPIESKSFSAKALPAARSDVAPDTYKFFLLENGEKFGIRGTTRVPDGEQWWGGDMKADPALEASPALFAHAKALWPRLVKRPL